MQRTSLACRADATFAKPEFWFCCCSFVHSIQIKHNPSYLLITSDAGGGLFTAVLFLFFSHCFSENNEYMKTIEFYK